MVSSQLQPDDFHLINRLNKFFRFDHQIFFIDSATALNPLFPTSSSGYGTELVNFTSQTVYTFDKLFNMSLEITSTNLFLIVLDDGLEYGNSSRSLAQVQTVRELDINLKMGVFFTNNITSLDLVEQWFRWSWSADIVNIFCAFHLNAVHNGDPVFNVFKYNPFGTFHLINVSGSESLLDYFSEEVPNYRQHPLRLTTINEISNFSIELKYWDTVLHIFNASMTKLSLGDAEASEADYVDGDVLLHEGFLDNENYPLLYPHRQSKLLLVVPHAQPNTDFVAYLQNGSGTWARLFVFTFVIIASSSVLLIISGCLHRRKKSLLFQCVVDVVNLLINDNAAIRYGNLHLADVFVIVPLTFTGLIVMNGILSLFQSFITSPVYQHQINTMH